MDSLEETADDNIELDYDDDAADDNDNIDLTDAPLPGTSSNDIEPGEPEVKEQSKPTKWKREKEVRGDNSHLKVKSVSISVFQSSLTLSVCFIYQEGEESSEEGEISSDDDDDEGLLKDDQVCKFLTTVSHAHASPNLNNIRILWHHF